jgi:hypothetical protein
VDFDVGEHPHLHAGGEPDSRRHELEAGSDNDLFGNVIVLVPMLLNSHPGAKYGVPFPVLARASFGVLGANLAAVSARSGGLRMVRHSDLDRRRSHQHSAGHARAAMEGLSLRHGGLLSCFLADQSRR